MTSWQIDRLKCLNKSVALSFAKNLIVDLLSENLWQSWWLFWKVQGDPPLPPPTPIDYTLAVWHPRLPKMFTWGDRTECL